jgi:hypothetical protein
MTANTLSIFGIAFSLGVYLLAGPSRLTRKAHVIFGFVGISLLALTALTTWSSPSDFDIDVVIYYMLAIGAVYFSILTIGYIRASDKPDVDLFNERKGREQDDRLR